MYNIRFQLTLALYTADPIETYAIYTTTFMYVRYVDILVTFIAATTRNIYSQKSKNFSYKYNPQTICSLTFFFDVKYSYHKNIGKNNTNGHGGKNSS